MSAALPTVGVRAAATEKLWESMQSLCYVDLPMFQAALREGADINCRELGRDFVRQLCYNLLKRQPGVRPLTLIRENRASIEEALRLLLAQPGLDVNAPGPGESALHAAMRMERPEAFVPDLLRVGADVRAVDSSTGNTPLHLARSPDVIDILLAAGAELAPNTFGQTPLHLRAQYADVECLSRLLLHPGAAAVLNAVEFNGQTPLHWHPDKALAMVKMLLRAGVDCTIADDYGRVPVDWEWVLHEYAHVPTRARVAVSLDNDDIAVEHVPGDCKPIPASVQRTVEALVVTHRDGEVPLQPDMFENITAASKALGLDLAVQQEVGWMLALDAPMRVTAKPVGEFSASSKAQKRHLANKSAAAEAKTPGSGRELQSWLQALTEVVEIAAANDWEVAQLLITDNSSLAALLVFVPATGGRGGTIRVHTAGATGSAHEPARAHGARQDICQMAHALRTLDRCSWLAMECEVA